MEETANQCPTCERTAGHSPAVRVIELANKLRREYLESYEIVDLIKKQWRDGR